MRLRAVHIENFRGIEFFEVTDLRDLVVIAGPNGCGKTAVLDGIRLLKSFYGGYSLNEWQMWFGEFQIDIAHPEGLIRLFRNRERQLQITAEIELSDTDRSYLQEHAEDALRSIVWQARLGRNIGRWRQAVSITEMNQYGEEVERGVHEGAAEVRRALEAESHHAGLTISPAGQIELMEEAVLELIFQTYSPHELGHASRPSGSAKGSLGTSCTCARDPTPHRAYVGQNRARPQETCKSAWRRATSMSSAGLARAYDFGEQTAALKESPQAGVVAECRRRARDGEDIIRVSMTFTANGESYSLSRHAKCWAGPPKVSADLRIGSAVIQEAAIETEIAIPR